MSDAPQENLTIRWRAASYHVDRCCRPPDPDARSSASGFYVEVLGLAVKQSHPVWVEYECFALAGDQSLSGTGEPEVYWLVDDAEAAYAEVAGKAEVVRPLEKMIFGKVFGIKDPAGRPRFVLELAKDRPSQAVK